MKILKKMPDAAKQDADEIYAMMGKEHGDMDGADEPELTDIDPPEDKRRWDQLTADYVKWTKEALCLETRPLTVADLVGLQKSNIPLTEKTLGEVILPMMRKTQVGVWHQVPLVDPNSFWSLQKYPEHKTAAEDSNSDSAISQRANDFVADVIAGRVTRPDRHKASEALEKAGKGDKVGDAIGRAGKGWAPFGLITKTDRN